MKKILVSNPSLLSFVINAKNIIEFLKLNFLLKFFRKAGLKKILQKIILKGDRSMIIISDTEKQKIFLEYFKKDVDLLKNNFNLDVEKWSNFEKN
jgi:hypothetical protein